MELTQAGLVTDNIMTKLVIEFPDVKWSVKTSFSPLQWQYKAIISWEDGPTREEVKEKLAELHRTMETKRNIVVIDRRTYSEKNIMDAAQEIANKSWLCVPLNPDNIRVLKINDVPLRTLAIYALRQKSFKK